MDARAASGSATGTANRSSYNSSYITAVAAENELLVLDEFLSFVDEVGDVGGGDRHDHATACASQQIFDGELFTGVADYTVPSWPTSTGAISSRTSSFDTPLIPEPVPLELLGDQRSTRDIARIEPLNQDDAEAIYHAMCPDEHEYRDDDDGEAESLGSPVSMSSETWHPEATNKEPPVQEKKKRRRRQKEELDYLRVRVKEMESELTRLRGEDIASSAVAVGTARALQLLPATTTIDLLDGDDDGGDFKSTRQPQRLWERIAHRQKDETQKAVMENIKLRALLEGQISVARSLESALRKKPRFAGAELHPYVGKGSTIRLDGDDEQKIYESIGLDLDVQYAQVDAVLQSSGIANIRREAIFDAEVRADGRGMFLEHKESRLVPFGVHAVGRAVWQTLGRQSMPLHDGVYISRETTDDTVCAKIVDTIRLPKAKSETVVTIRLVLKRFVEEHRVVSVWESMVETVGPVCLRLREKAWNVLKPHYVNHHDYDAHSSTTTSTEPTEMCLAQSIIRVWPEMAMSEYSENTEVGTLTNLVVGSYERNLGVMAQIIQNLLSDEAKKQQHDQDAGSSTDYSP